MRVKEARLKLRCATNWFILLIFFVPSLANAWNNKAHTAIAYLAYKRLDRHARDRVDEILVLHPLYSQWTKGAKLGQAGLLAFMHAATWPDCIQTPACPGYVEDGTDGGMVPTAGQEEWQNVGFSDRLMHKYWHFIALPFPENAGTPAPRPNLETQFQIITDTLNSNTEDPLKSYDLAWIENLVAEAHQPLNCVSRFSPEHPQGDHNGRDVKVREGDATESLHEYWDNLLGTEEDLESATKEGKALTGVQDPNGLWESVDVDQWVGESVALAKELVYTPDVISEENQGKVVVLSAAYRKAATQAALKQAVLAGNRLALVLNKNLQ